MTWIAGQHLHRGLRGREAFPGSVQHADERFGLLGTGNQQTVLHHEAGYAGDVSVEGALQVRQHDVSVASGGEYFARYSVVQTDLTG